MKAGWLGACQQNRVQAKLPGWSEAKSGTIDKLSGFAALHLRLRLLNQS